MCGRYELDPAELPEWMLDVIAALNRGELRTGFPPTDNLQIKTGEVFPTDRALVFSRGGPERMRWGLPSPSGGALINARAETAASKPMFRESLAARRLAVPTTGFYEWEHPNGKTGAKHRFHPADGRLMYLAGLYQDCVTESGTREKRFAILTTVANAGMARFHDRMPVHLLPDELDDWFAGGAFADAALRREQPELAHEQLTPGPPEQLGLF